MILQYMYEQGKISKDCLLYTSPGGNTQKLKDQKEDPGSHPEKEGHDQQEKPVIGYKKKMAENAGRNRGHVSVEPQGHPRFLY